LFVVFYIIEKLKKESVGANSSGSGGSARSTRSSKKTIFNFLIRVFSLDNTTACLGVTCDNALQLATTKHRMRESKIFVRQNIKNWIHRNN
jgi:hypothetical protein